MEKLSAITGFEKGESSKERAADIKVSSEPFQILV